MELKICCVTGHREIPPEQALAVRKALEREVDQALAEGFTYFISGFAQGVDQAFAGIIAKKRLQNPALRLEAALPYRSRCRALGKQPKALALLEGCTDISVISEDYGPMVYHLRNQYMVNRAQRVIAVYDGRVTGGTAATLRAVRLRGREVREILLPPREREMDGAK